MRLQVWRSQGFSWSCLGLPQRHLEMLCGFSLGLGGCIFCDICVGNDESKQEKGVPSSRGTKRKNLMVESDLQFQKMMKCGGPGVLYLQICPAQILLVDFHMVFEMPHGRDGMISRRMCAEEVCCRSSSFSVCHPRAEGCSL